MFRFEDPQYLYLLALLPVLVLIRYFLLSRQRKKLRKHLDPELMKMLTPDASRWRPVVKFWLIIAALALLIIAVARPQMGAKITNEKRVGIETVICVDISNSMYAEDVAPSRLERSKMLVENLVDNFIDDKIGLIVFAGDAFVQLPITSDYVSAKLFLDNINPSMITTQGTDLGRAIQLATNSFTKQEGIGRAIIVITDGENHEGGAVEAAEEAQKEGMNVYVLGVGDVNGAPIPVPGTGDYMKDNSGNTVMTALNTEMCKEVASAGNGAFIHVTNNSRAQELLNDELDKLSQMEIESSIHSEYDEQFQAFCLLIILLLILETCLLDRKNPLLKSISLFGKKKVVMIITLMTLSTAVMAQNDRHYVREGNKSFRGNDFVKAEEDYRKAIEKNGKNPQATYNLGNALMAQQKDSAAIESLQKAAELETNPQRKAMAYHNIGVICQNHQMYGEAMDAYKQALRNNPNDDTTRYNYELCRRQKKDQDQNQQNQDQQQQDQQQKQDQQQQEQQKQEQQQQQQQQKMSKEAAEQMLNAAKQQEKNTNERMEKMQQQPSSRRLEKNW